MPGPENHSTDQTTRPPAAHRSRVELPDQYPDWRSYAFSNDAVVAPENAQEPSES